jgi:hypothetical protein
MLMPNTWSSTVVPFICNGKAQRTPRERRKIERNGEGREETGRERGEEGEEEKTKGGRERKAKGEPS